MNVGLVTIKTNKHDLLANKGMLLTLVSRNSKKTVEFDQPDSVTGPAEPGVVSTNKLSIHLLPEKILNEGAWHFQLQQP
ncbi:hypothetical protein DPMN_067068 [Dreissena polymorpha]|uniref:Uncharacterized protein n=1 Tax=Dreissena polymorpha TaxID=45954 RepID=A0A9D4BVJ6_DREPO|nr:hypothetical protein DPMN_067068 [Dreissena polymorpha]